MRPEEIDGVFDAWDADGSGLIEWDEFNRHLRQDMAAVSSLRRALRAQEAKKPKGGKKAKA